MPELRVLLVEDDPDDVALLQAGLTGRRVGWRLEHAALLESALDWLSRPDQFDAVLLDVHLPDAFGTEPVTRIRALAPDLAIVVLTGGGGKDDVTAGVEALQHGADDYLAKGARLTMGAIERAVTYAAERRLVAKRLEATEARYRQLVEVARDMIYRSDIEGRFTYVNPVAVRTMGYSAEELVGKHFVELIRPDQQENVSRHYAAQFQTLTPSTTLEFVAITKDGREVWIEQNVQAIVESSRIVAFQAVARDVTERKTYENERERLISELQAALGQVRTLSGLLPICANCRRIKDEEDGSWNQLEQYFSKKNAGTQVTHGVCPECTRKLYPHMRPKT